MLQREPHVASNTSCAEMDGRHKILARRMPSSRYFISTLFRLTQGRESAEMGTSFTKYKNVTTGGRHALASRRRNPTPSPRILLAPALASQEGKSKRPSHEARARRDPQLLHYFLCNPLPFSLARTHRPAGKSSKMEHPNPDLMRRAIELSAQGGLKERTGGVFGAIVARKDTGEIVGEGFNRECAGELGWVGPCTDRERVCACRHGQIQRARCFLPCAGVLADHDPTAYD